MNKTCQACLCTKCATNIYSEEKGVCVRCAECEEAGKYIKVKKCFLYKEDKEEN